jgi:hypothetical protein
VFVEVATHIRCCGAGHVAPVLGVTDGFVDDLLQFGHRLPELRAPLFDLVQVTRDVRVHGPPPHVRELPS